MRPLTRQVLRPSTFTSRGEDYLLFAKVNFVLIQSHCDFLRDVATEQEDALYSGLAGAGTHHANIGAPSEQQAQRIHDDRLAGPRLPGQHAKAGRQLNFELFYGGEVGDTKESEHRYVRNSTFRATPLGLPKSTVTVGAHAYAESRYGGGPSTDSTTIVA